MVQAELQSSQVGPKLSLKVLLKDFSYNTDFEPKQSLSSTCCSSPLLEYGPKTWKLALKSRDGRHLAADCYECKTSKQFFKIKYRLPLMKKLFLAKGRKIIELPYELHHVFVMMIA